MRNVPISSSIIFVAKAIRGESGGIKTNTSSVFTTKTMNALAAEIANRNDKAVEFLRVPRKFNIVPHRKLLT